WGVYAHWRGKPSLSDPTKPSSSSGAAHLPGDLFLVTLGGWAGADGRDPEDIVAYTTAHELGHNLYRGHSGDPVNALEYNCNPNFLSIMNWGYQVEGLLNASGEPVLDFSGSPLPGSINENNLPGNLGTLKYRPGWYAPRSGVHQSLQTTAAKRHCDGTALSQFALDENGGGRGYVRINGTGILVTTPGSPIDWNGDLSTANEATKQDVTFNGPNGPAYGAFNVLTGSDDWTAIKAIGLRQVGSGRSL